MFQVIWDLQKLIQLKDFKMKNYNKNIRNLRHLKIYLKKQNNNLT